MNLNQKQIFFITGASGVGKTTAIEALQAKHKGRDDLRFLNFDSIGVPSLETMNQDYGSPEEWQRQTTKQWVKRLMNEFEEPLIILEGQVNLDFIEEAFADQNFENWRTVLIDCEESEMLNRITERGQPELATDDMCHWRQYLRDQAESKGVLVVNTAGKIITDTVQDLEEVFGIKA
jgi:thymidylate kinase